jgi:hypothetical protein
MASFDAVLFFTLGFFFWFLLVLGYFSSPFATPKVAKHQKLAQSVFS